MANVTMGGGMHLSEPINKVKADKVDMHIGNQACSKDIINQVMNVIMNKLEDAI